MPTLSVVVPATDRPATLPRAVAAIERAGGADDARRRSGPAAAPRTRALAAGWEVVVVDGPAELSVCAARNLGARQAAGDVVVFVDADVEVRDDALRRIGEAFDTRPELTAVFGSYDDSPSAGGTVAAFRNLLHHHVHQGAAGPAETFWSGLGAVRREAFLAVGGFDGDRFPHPSVEDVDLGARLVAAGARIELDPAIQGTHLKAWTLRAMVATDFARRGVPWVALQLRAGRASTALNLGWRHRVSAAACTLAVLALPVRRPAVAAAALLVLLGLNRDFYALLARRRGPGEALVGVGLHVVHHLTAVASVPAGVLSHVRDRRSSREQREQREQSAAGAAR